MITAPLHPQEADRLDELLRYEVLDTEDEASLDELTELASEICGVPISLISLVDHDRQWFKSKVGLNVPDTNREVAFCSHAILQDGVMEVVDTLEDQRFHDNPLVTGAPDIRFYAGAPLKTPAGLPLGTLCVIDTKPRELTGHQKRALEILSNQVVRQLDLRLQQRRLERQQEEREKLYGILAHDLRSPFNGILGLSSLLKDMSGNLDRAKIAELSETIFDSSMKLFQVVDEILQWTDSSRLRRSDCELVDCDISFLLEESARYFDQALKVKGLHIDMQLGQKQMQADTTLAKTVFRNLLSNAIKYSIEGATIYLSTRKEMYDGKPFLVLRVENQGPSVDAEVKERIFRERVRSSTGTMGEIGHGLGLSLSNEFMLLQGGSMRLDDRYQGGAAFEVLFPV